jgi:hypothetical protein
MDDGSAFMTGPRGAERRSELSARIREGDIEIAAKGIPALLVVVFVVTLMAVIALG